MNRREFFYTFGAGIAGIVGAAYLPAAPTPGRALDISQKYLYARIRITAEGVEDLQHAGAFIAALDREWAAAFRDINARFDPACFDPVTHEYVLRAFDRFPEVNFIHVLKTYPDPRPIEIFAR